MNQVNGGCVIMTCGCNCKWVNKGGSSAFDNSAANRSNGWPGGNDIKDSKYQTIHTRNCGGNCVLKDISGDVKITPM